MVYIISIMMNAIIGGILIGLAVSIMLLFNGRVTGISGIIAGAIRPKKNDFLWRLTFILGLMMGGLCIQKFQSSSLEQVSIANLGDYIFAGILVGVGSLLGSGCTSGHGVCGISRLSKRSILATMTFIVFGMMSLGIFKLIRGAI